MRRDSATPVLAICGGGNAAHTLAVVASQRFDGEIAWLAGSPEKAELLRRGVFSAEGLRATGAVTGRADRVGTISSDPAEVIPDADVVMIAVPAFGHGPILARVGPHLKDGAMVGALPSRSGFEFEATALLSEMQPRARRGLFALQTLPWSTRIQEPAKTVHVGVCKSRVLMATLPEAGAAALAGQLTEWLGLDVVATSNFLDMTLGNPGQIIHPGIMYGLFSDWSGDPYREEDIPRFYAGVTDQAGAFVERLSAETVSVARAIEARSKGTIDCSGVLPIHDWLRTSYPTQTSDLTSAATCFRTGPLQARKAPMREIAPHTFVPDFRYRYLSEDVPYGLAVAKGIAELAGVATPAIDAVVGWTQDKLGKRYLADGELAGADARKLRIPQNYGITTLDALIDWYRQWSPVAAARRIA